MSTQVAPPLRSLIFDAGKTARLRVGTHIPAAVVGLVVTLMCLPSVLLTYGLKDDYTYLAGAHGYLEAGTREPASSIRLGRPLFGLLTSALFSALPSVTYLWIPRALSIAGLALFGILLYRTLLPVVRVQTTAALIAVLISSLPPFLVYAGWATLFCAPYSLSCGALAGLAAARAADTAGAARIRWLVGGNALLLLALAMYQPTAMAFWLIAFIGAIGRRHSPASLGRFLRQVAWVAAPAMVGGYLMLKIGVWTLGAASAQRSGLISDIPAKLRWLPQPLGLSLNLFNMPQSAAIAAVSAIIVLAGAVLFLRDCDKRLRATYAALTACLIPLSFAPSILTQENYATFRTVGPLTATFGLLAALAFVALARDGGHRLRIGARGALAAMAVLSVGLGFNHLRTLLVVPQSHEWHELVRQVSRLPARPAIVGFLAPDIDEGPITVRYGVRDEFGVPTSASDWADPSMTWLAAVQARRVFGTALKVRVSSGPAAVRTPNVPYIDMRRLTRLH